MKQKVKNPVTIKDGFTLIELAIILVVLGILLTMGAGLDSQCFY